MMDMLIFLLEKLITTYLGPQTVGKLFSFMESQLLLQHCILSWTNWLLGDCEYCATVGPADEDMYGRGFSESPGVDYTRTLYVKQLHGLLNAVGWTGCDIIGYSMGGAVATLFVERHPDIINRVCLIGTLI
jgi:homoserine acetyltransferase